MAHSLILPLDATMKGGKTITKAFLTVHTYLHIRYASIAKCIQML